MSDYRRDNERYRTSGRDGYSRPRSSRPARETRYQDTRQDRPRRETSGQSRPVREEPRAYHQSTRQTRSSQQGYPRRQAPGARSPYLDEQMRKRAPRASNYRSHSAQDAASRDRRRVSAAQQATWLHSPMVRIVAIVVLLAIFILRFVLQGGVITESFSVRAQARDQQTQLEQLTASNADIQSQIDSMQPTIDAWNEMHNS